MIQEPKQQTQPRESPLVRRLLAYKRAQDRGALAALRTGLGKKPGEAPRMLPLVAPFLGDADHGAGMAAAFLTAALFGSHPEHQAGVSVGTALRIAVSAKHGQSGVEARLAAALDSHPDDLPRHLEALVSLCQSASVPLDWHRLYFDAKALLSENEQWREATRIRWARDFWANSAPDQTTHEESE